jgi:hypothetical protein
MAAVFSETKAWKGGTSNWLSQQIEYVKDRVELFASFGSPYLFHDSQGGPRTVKIFAYWDAESAQRAVAKIIALKAPGMLKKSRVS